MHMALLYSLAIRLFTFGIHVAAWFYPKARKWVAGRQDWRRRYRATFQKKGRVLWVHAASLGEFEQGRPVIEAFRTRFPDWQVVLTFFSPSGYEVRQHYAQADFVAYLPADTPRNVADFLDIVRPDAVVFVKYEFWFHYLTALRQRGIPTLLVSALFRPRQPFFQPWGRFWRRGLMAFTHFFVQNQDSAQLLQGIGFQNVTVAGDTRIDRVLEIAAMGLVNEVVEAFVVGLAPPSPPVKGGSSSVSKKDIGSLLMEKAQNSAAGNSPSPPFTGGLGGASSTEGSERVYLTGGVEHTHPTLFLGSTWEADETILEQVLSNDQTTVGTWKTIVAPHEPSEKNVRRLLRYPQAVRYSEATPDTLRTVRLLVIDNVGMLNTLYRYGTVAYIGGGFGAGIHNTLEPAAFGLPIIFGPKYTKFAEARAFVERGAAFPVRNAGELAAVLHRLTDPAHYQPAAEAARNFLAENRGATAKVLAFLETRLAKL